MEDEIKEVYLLLKKARDKLMLTYYKYGMWVSDKKRKRIESVLEKLERILAKLK